VGLPAPRPAVGLMPRLVWGAMSGVQLTESPSPRKRTGSGVGRVLVAVYAILALAATGRSVFQIIDRFEEAPVAFTLSAFSGVIYIIATIALGTRLRRLAFVTISIELAGVLIVGALSLLAPAVLGLHSIDPFGRDSTVWSAFGAGYLLIPLVLPVLGLLYLRRSAGQDPTPGPKA
jgi:cytochrome bd-type quinol oxidase subunit 2